MVLRTLEDERDVISTVFLDAVWVKNCSQPSCCWYPQEKFAIVQLLSIFNLDSTSW